MPYKILICDDQPIIHETLGVYLREEGFDVCSAYDGSEALLKFESELPDMIILDIMMPKVTGIEVCREIRHKSDVPIIMLTAKGEEIDRVLGLELGADECRALARLDVLEFNDLKDIARSVVKSNSVFEISCNYYRCHGRNLRNRV